MKYTVEILKGMPFDGNKHSNKRKNFVVLDRDDTVIVTMHNEDGIAEKFEYGYIHCDDVYKMIMNYLDINLNHTYIKDFDYSNNVIGSKPMLNFTAINAFFDGEVDFTEANFGDRNVSFRDANFGDGNVTFVSTNFGEGTIDFSGVKIRDGNVSFREANFGDGNVSFLTTEFGEGDVDFTEADFGDGNVIFFGANFGEGDVDFWDTKFGEGDVTFSGAKIGDGRIAFFNANFEEGYLDFSIANFEGGEVFFLNVKFGDVSFEGCSIKNLDFDTSIFNNYSDLRLLSCEYLAFINCTFRDIIDMRNTSDLEVYIKSLNLRNSKNLGKIYMEWNKKLISKQYYIDKYNNQRKTNFKEKADQYRLLKENFHSLGQYDDEDSAYVGYKRCNMLAKLFGQCTGSKVTKVVSIIWAWLTILPRWLITDFIGKYGTSPGRVVLTMLFTLIGFGLLYYNTKGLSWDRNLYDFTDSLFLQFSAIVSWINNILSTNIDSKELFMCFNHSAITFLTIGYGNTYPKTSQVATFSAIEGFMGMFLMSYFTVAFVRKVLR